MKENVIFTCDFSYDEKKCAGNDYLLKIISPFQFLFVPGNRFHFKSKITEIIVWVLRFRIWFESSTYSLNTNRI